MTYCVWTSYTPPHITPQYSILFRIYTCIYIYPLGIPQHITPPRDAFFNALGIPQYNTPPWGLSRPRAHVLYCGAPRAYAVHHTPLVLRNTTPLLGGCPTHEEMCCIGGYRDVLRSTEGKRNTTNHFCSTPLHHTSSGLCNTL